MKEDDSAVERLDALAHIDAAIALCDGMGETVVACHLQYGADLLRQRAAELPRRFDGSLG